MNIQGPTQSLFDQATDPGTSVPISQVLADTFTTNTLGTKWTVLGGTWTESNGTLSQTARRGFGGQEGSGQLHHSLSRGRGDRGERAAGLNSRRWPRRSQPRNDSNGNGYNLVFHESTMAWRCSCSTTTSPGRTPVTGLAGRSPRITPSNSWWSRRGMVWTPSSARSGRAGRPSRLNGRSRRSWAAVSRSPGVPAFVAGSSGSGGYATADFQPVRRTTGSLVWAVTPSLFSAVDSTRWQSLQGTWCSDRRSALPADTSSNTNKRVIFPMAGTAPSSMMITAEVTPGMNLSDPNLGTSTVGVGLDTDSTGNGYELAFVKDRLVAWGPAQERDHVGHLDQSTPSAPLQTGLPTGCN